MIALDHLQQKQLAAKPPKGQPVTDSHDTVCFTPADVRLHTDLCLITGHSVKMTEAAFSMKIHVSSTVSKLAQWAAAATRDFNVHDCSCFISLNSKVSIYTYGMHLFTDGE